MREDADYMDREWAMFSQDNIDDCPVFNKVWIKKDGESVKIKDMESSHIRNCIKIIDRRKSWRVEYREILQEELEKRNA